MVSEWLSAQSIVCLLRGESLSRILQWSFEMYVYKPKGLNRRSKSLKGNRSVSRRTHTKSPTRFTPTLKLPGVASRDSRFLGFFSPQLALVIAVGGLSGLLFDSSDTQKQEPSVVKASFEKSATFGKIDTVTPSKSSAVKLGRLKDKIVKPKKVAKSTESPKITKVRPKLQFLESGLPKLDKSFFREAGFAKVNQMHAGKKIELTIDKRLQDAATKLLNRYQVKNGAIVAIEPSTGKIKALASRSVTEKKELPLALRSGFPAASLFKIVTGAAAIEESGLSGRSEIKYRGGDYSLNKSNYKPDTETDTRKMKLDDAMGRSVNPVFARVALKNLNSDILGDYAKRFGFMESFTEELPVESSGFGEIKDDFELARTAAGFGDVSISPLHAALLSATIANDGVMMKPYLVESIASKEGEDLYNAQTQPWGRVLLSSTARELNDMMLKTSTSGTSKKQFRRWRKTALKNVKVAAKTGTLSGKNPRGRYLWFTGSAPADQPDLSVAVLVVDSGGGKIGSSALARLFFEEYFSEKTL